MKRLLTLFATALLAFSAFAQPDTPVVQFLKGDVRRAAFNTHSYEFGPIHDTPAPKGYKPFYISHYGRHGSRSDWGGPQYKLVRDLLTEADRQHLLTPAGDSLMHEAALLYELHNGMDGRLTPRGVKEHARLAERMYRRYPEVFKNGSKHIRAVSSTTPRCIVSMNGFTGRMMSLQPDLDFDLDTGEKYYAYIARGENSTLIARTNKALADYRKTIDWDNETVYRNLFTDPAAAKKLIPDAYEFQNAIYDCARVSDPFDIPDNMYRYLPFGNVVHFHELNFLSAYLNQCDSKLNGEIRLPRSQELVDTLISQADAVISGKVKKAADLCFGHDWPYLGLVCYLGLEGVSERYTLEEAKDLWLPSWFCPFAANLQMIFYRSKKSDEILVKFLMNERETRLPALQAVQGPYYRWNDVKAWCEKRIPKTEIVAHRGYWEGNAENSIASFRKAQEFGCWGSEFDIHLTADGVPVINHDQVIAGTDIQKSSFEDVRAHRLANGEHVPTLAEYMAQAARSRECMPVLELKPQATPEKEDELVDKCLQALRPAAPRNVPPEFASFARRQEPTKVVFISFSHHICQELAKKAPDYTVQYLNGDLSPAQLHAEGINGLDYHYSVFYKHPEWVKEAQDLGMSVNVWTVDDPKDIRAMRDLGVDQITTNKPALVREILWER
ncbi:MAG: histidine-type phosphatase [Bacteroidales bacterium]|nr:histidine-type phosphatase [Bacteroidales bacterium]